MNLKDRIKGIKRNLKKLPFALSLMATFSIIFDFGFEHSQFLQIIIDWLYILAISTGSLSLVGRYLIRSSRPLSKVWLFDALLLIFLLAVFFNFFGHAYLPFFNDERWLRLAVFSVLLREFSSLNFNISQQYLNPARLFMLSFILIIAAGTGLLLLPRATHEGISVLDALFTSTSAVCVTGLIVVDTGSYFTSLGQSIILVLIQIGGLGIMTFTSYFSYFFRGGSSYENQLTIQDMTNSERIADVFKTLRKIIMVTFILEGAGAGIIFFTIKKGLIPEVGDRIFFSVFHSISGFCNAGFSTLPNSLYQSAFRYNYPMHLVIAFLLILGGIGFPIIFNFFKYLRHAFVNRVLPYSRNREAVHAPWVISINSRIVLVTTAILIVAGTVVFYILEYNNTLAEHSAWGKVVTAFFGAVTPRTAGFNTVDNAALHFPTVMFIFLLMWIGASPGSTGGGIKTSTFAIGTLNFLSIARGKDRIEVFKREVSPASTSKAFAVIALSLVVIGFAIMFIALFDGGQSLLSIAFECFSAYSTVGLSLGITAQLSDPSRLVLILTMFIGRVSMLTILIALMRQVKYLQYRYPTEEILIT